MSYIRYGQEGRYIDIPEGSQSYIHDNGTDISGWSYAEFAALIGSVVDEISYDNSGAIKTAFRQYFGGWDADYNGKIEPPERAEIFCQCVDARIDGVELTDSLQEQVQNWADEYDALRECQYCEKEFRPKLFVGEGDFTCEKEECGKKHTADMWDVTVQIVEQEERVFYELYENYGFEQGEASDRATDYLIEMEDRNL